SGAERGDAEMPVEAAVLGGEHGLGDIGRQRIEPHMAAAQAALGKHGAVLGKDGYVGRPIVERGDDRIGNAGDEIDDRRAEHDAAPDRRQEREADTAREPRMPRDPALQAMRASPLAWAASGAARRAGSRLAAAAYSSAGLCAPPRALHVSPPCSSRGEPRLRLWRPPGAS